MKVLGLDVSTNSTGWCILKTLNSTPELFAYGLIHSDKTMSFTQRLYLLGNELKKIIETHQPDEIGIEEVVFIRGQRILKMLSRCAGVAIFQAYAFQKKEPYFFEPPAWKKNLGISGSSLKPEVQVEICSRFNLLTQEQVERYEKLFNEIKANISTTKSDAKKQGIKKKDLNKQLKVFEKQYEKISADIYSDCGINNDIADSVGVALAVFSNCKDSQ